MEYNFLTGILLAMCKLWSNEPGVIYPVIKLMLPITWSVSLIIVTPDG